MSIKRDSLLKYLNELLEPHKFKDYCPNGLQVEGKQNINTIVCGVTASKALIDKAIELNADAIFVHHGYFWKNESYPIVGMKKTRIEALIKNDINLYAYHLPLDAHPTFGNNVQLAKKLSLEITGELNTNTIPSIGITAQLSKPTSPAEFTKHISNVLGKQTLHISNNKPTIQHIGICTGGAQGFISNAAEQGLDAYLSGEISENTTHTARECNIDYFAAGHHATERFGAKAIAEHLDHIYDIEAIFVDIDNPA
jgi:dinuclear metal center YbgI/SA1388 family protein